MNTRSIRHSLLATALTISAHAADWTGTADTNYNNALNWTPQGDPSSATDIAIASGTAVRTGNLDRAAASTVSATGSLTVTGGRFLNANGGAANFSLTGGSLTQTGNYFIVAVNNTGAINQSGGTVTSTVDRGWFLSDALTGVGTYHLTGGNLNVTATGGNDTNWNIHIGKGAGGDLLHIDGGTATFTATAASFQTYISKSGVMQLDSGSATFNGMRYFTVGRNFLEGTTSRLVINDGTLIAGNFDNSAAASPAAFTIGNNNDGEVQLNGGILDISTASLWIGDGTRPGSFVQTGGTLNLTGPTMTVGRTTKGAFTSTGGVVNATLTGDMTMGNVSSDDRMTVDGGEVNLTGAGGNRVYIRHGSALTVESGDMEVRNFQYFSIGRDGDGTAKLAVNGGKLEVAPATDRTSAFIVGGQGGQGELDVSGGELHVTEGSMWIADGLGGAFTQTGGAVTVDNSLFVGKRDDAAAPGTLTLEDGTLSAMSLQIPFSHGSSVQLNGGTLNVGYIMGGGAPSGTVEFNGTEIKISTDPFGMPVISNLETALIGAGGLRIDLPADQEASIGQVLVHSPSLGAVKDGGVIKRGGGTLYLDGQSEYTGRTEVVAGRLSMVNPSLDDRSEVVVSATGKLDLAHGQTDVVRRVVLGGQVLATGLWGGPSSGAPKTHPLLDGTGFLQVTNLADQTPFEQWIAASGVPSSAAGPDDDADHDGVSNLLEFALGGAPGSGSSRGVSSVVPSGGSSVFTLAVRTGAVFTPDGTRMAATVDGVHYVIEGTGNLTSWDAAVQEVTPAVAGGLSSPGAAWELRSFRLTGAATGKGFLRAGITGAP